MTVNDAIAQVARRHNKTVGQVKKEMQEAIEEAYQNPTPEARKEQEKIRCKGKIPTVEEFMKHMLNLKP